MASTHPQLSDPGQPDPLAQLRDIHLPGSIETWPPAPGWWLLAIMAICAVAYGCCCLYKLWQKNRYRREAITSLKELRREYQQDPESVDYLERYSQLLKRVALSHYSREQVASLTGEAWVAFLDQTGSTSEFGMGPGQVLIDGNYSRGVFYQVDDLHKIGDRWIRNHAKLESPE